MLNKLVNTFWPNHSIDHNSGLDHDFNLFLTYLLTRPYWFFGYPWSHISLSNWMSDQIGPMGICVEGSQADTLPTLGPIGSVAYPSTHDII